MRDFSTILSVLRLQAPRPTLYQSYLPRPSVSFAGAEVTVASVEDSTEVVCSRGVRLVADALLSDLPTTSTYDAIALPVRSRSYICMQTALYV